MATTAKATTGATAGAAAKAAPNSGSKSGSKAAARSVATPWGKASLVEELTVAQRAGERRFASLVQLLEGPAGEPLVRFAYSTGGSVRRGPVTLRARDLAKLREALETRPALAAALGVVAAPGLSATPGGDA